MTKIKLLTAIAATALLATGCGGEKSAQSDTAKSGKTVSASKAKSGGEIADVYVSQLTKIADAVESVEDEKTAKKAAKAIASASKELEALAEKVETMDQTKQAMIFATRAQDFMGPQVRLATAMQKMATENPEHMELIQAELEKLPEFSQ